MMNRWSLHRLGMTPRLHLADNRLYSTQTMRMEKQYGYF